MIIYVVDVYTVDNVINKIGRPQPIILNFLPIILLSSAQKVTHYV